MMRFLEIDAETRASAVTLSQLLTPHFDTVIEEFYVAVKDFQINPHVTDKSIAALKQKQKQHWLSLFHSRFDDEFFAGVSRIGVRHRDIDLNPMWYVAGYTRLKLAFIEVIIRSDLHAITKGQLVKTLDKYVAVDMALAMSAYDAVILD
jgi:methyl-accepting chemotaxis protein